MNKKKEEKKIRKILWWREESVDGRSLRLSVYWRREGKSKVWKHALVLVFYADWSLSLSFARAFDSFQVVLWERLILLCLFYYSHFITSFFTKLIFLRWRLRGKVRARDWDFPPQKTWTWKEVDLYFSCFLIKK